MHDKYAIINGVLFWCGQCSMTQATQWKQRGVLRYTEERPSNV